MLKQKLFTTTIAALLAMGASQAQGAEMLQKIGKGEGRVDIVAWPGYIERGETDPNFDWVTKFEKSSGCMVNIKTANTSDEMVALMNEGGFDLVTANSVKVLVNLIVTMIALPVFVLQGNVVWAPALVLAVGFLAGGWLGAKLAVQGGERMVRVFMIGAALFLAGRLIGLW